MVSEVKTVECVICHKTHLEVPAEKQTLNKDGVMVLGFNSRNWGYYRDFYKGAYSVICKLAHDRVLAPKMEA